MARNESDPNLEMTHASIHAEYRQALADAQWALVNANAQLRVRDSIIGELYALIEAATVPGE